MATAATALTTSFEATRHSLLHTFKAPLLANLLRVPAEPSRRAVTLDLGPPCQSLLDRLAANRPCRLEIADLVRHGGLEQLNSPEIEVVGPAIVARLLPPPNREPLDLILLWDLPNYLGLKALGLLIGELAKRAGPGCKLHMLIAYSKREMAAKPCRYIPIADGKLQQHMASTETGPAPRYSPEDLGRAVGGGFRYARGVLLANGMQEFVYAWPDQPGIDAAF